MRSTMTAAVYTGYGSPDVLQLKDVEKPVPADNEVLIKIHATTVEAADASFRRGNTPSARLFTGLLKPRFAIPGSEFAGEIEALGNGVTRFKHGDQIVGSAGAGFRVGQAVRFRCHRAVFCQTDVRSIRAETGTGRANNLVTCLETGDIFADDFNLPGKLTARDRKSGREETGEQPC